MKIWITRKTTGSLHSGGLNRCDVWFYKPIWIESKYELNNDPNSPFGADEELAERYGYTISEWKQINIPNDIFKGSIPFSNLFGYGDITSDDNRYVPGIANYVWNKLNEHYGNTKFVQGWYEYEEQGKCHQKDFLLEIDLDIKMI